MVLRSFSFFSFFFVVALLFSSEYVCLPLFFIPCSFPFSFFFLSVQAMQKKESFIELLFLCGPQAEWFVSWITPSSFSLRSRIPAGKRGDSFFFSLLMRPRFGALSRTHFFPSRQFILGCVSSAFVMCKVSSGVFIFDALSPCLSLDQHC